MIVLPRYKDKHVAVFGLGKSGQASVRALQESGAHVYAWADATEGLEGLPLVSYEEWDWDNLDLLVLSPGVPLHFPEPHPVVELARASNIRITCDVTLLMEACPDATFVGITGTNGKSTTTTLISHCLSDMGATMQCGGNIGVPVLEMEALGEGGVYVLELSSYQLDLMDAEPLDIACLLNISADHIDRHGNMKHYKDAKESIFARQSADDVAIIATDDMFVREIAERVPHIETSLFSSRADYYMKATMLHDKATQESYDIGAIDALQGLHNYQNALVAFAVCRKLGYEGAAIMQAMQGFGGLPHRMERLGRVNNVLYINDSKATNADSAAKSLGTFRNIYWIVGGVAKEGGITSLAPLFERVRHAYVIGESANDFSQTLDEHHVSHNICHTLENAMNLASVHASTNPESVVLFAPAAASFDQFANFEERGDAFKGMVVGL